MCPKIDKLVGCKKRQPVIDMNGSVANEKIVANSISDLEIYKIFDYFELFKDFLAMDFIIKKGKIVRLIDVDNLTEDMLKSYLESREVFPSEILFFADKLDLTQLKILTYEFISRKRFILKSDVESLPEHCNILAKFYNYTKHIDKNFSFKYPLLFTISKDNLIKEIIKTHKYLKSINGE